jgi:predicted Zn-dependent protease
MAIWRADGTEQEAVHAAREMLGNGRWDDALQLLAAARADLPDEVVVDEAQALRGKKQDAAAIDLLRQSLASRPDSVHRQEWWQTTGGAYADTGNWPEAIVAYRQAATNSPGTSTWHAYIQLGWAMYRSGKPVADATAVVSRGISLRPSESEGYSVMGDILTAEHNFAKADTWYVSAIERDPRNVWYVVRRIDNLVAAGDDARVRQVVSTALARMATEPHLYYELGQLDARQGDLTSAIAATSQAVALDRGRTNDYQNALARLQEQAARLSSVGGQ